ncbi:MAG: hypothetical protein KGZ30_04160 [Anaplasmataceae bacterium]|nr:hypothetical protein [Anaplasmataceae bacterium]
MTPFPGFGSNGGMTIVPPPWVRWMISFFIRLPWIVGGLIVVVVLLLTTRYVLAGCNIIPEIPEEERVAEVCEMVDPTAGDQCFLEPRNLMVGTIVAREEDFDFFAKGKTFGPYPLPVGSVPAEPWMCGDEDFIEARLKYYTGPVKLQEDLQDAFREIRGGEITFLNEVLGTIQAPGSCTIKAMFQVGRRGR